MFLLLNFFYVCSHDQFYSISVSRIKRVLTSRYISLFSSQSFFLSLLWFASIFHLFSVILLQLRILMNVTQIYATVASDFFFLVQCNFEKRSLFLRSSILLIHTFWIIIDFWVREVESTFWFSWSTSRSMSSVLAFEFSRSLKLIFKSKTYCSSTWFRSLQTLILVFWLIFSNFLWILINTFIARRNWWRSRSISFTYSSSWSIESLSRWKYQSICLNW